MNNVFRTAVGLACVLSSFPVSAATIQLDYRFDSGFFAAGSSARESLETAALVFESLITDSLEPIVPVSGNFWTADFNDPSTGLSTGLVDLVVPADTIVVFVGTRDLTGAAIGSAGPGSYFASGSAAWGTTVATRGQGNTSGALADDFGPWGGTIAIDDTVSWNLDHSVDPQGSENDLYSVLIHEFGHVFGVGTADSWFNQVAGGTFTGSAASIANQGSVPLMSDDAHWKDGITSTRLGTLVEQEAAFDPSITVGTRKMLTNLDAAGLADIGWQVIPEPHSGILVAIGALALLFLRQRNQ